MLAAQERGSYALLLQQNQRVHERLRRSVRGTGVRSTAAALHSCTGGKRGAFFCCREPIRLLLLSFCIARRDFSSRLSAQATRRTCEPLAMVHQSMFTKKLGQARSAYGLANSRRGPEWNQFAAAVERPLEEFKRVSGIFRWNPDVSHNEAQRNVLAGLTELKGALQLCKGPPKGNKGARDAILVSL